MYVCMYVFMYGMNDSPHALAPDRSQFSSDSTSSATSSSSPGYHTEVLGPDGVGYAWKATESAFVHSLLYTYATYLTVLCSLRNWRL